MASCGLDRETGLPLSDLDHVAQSVEVIYTTRLGETIMLRHFGSGLPELLGKRVTPRLLSAYRTLLALPITLWEPRLRVASIAAQGNVVDAVRLGDLKFQVLAHYRPRGHLGDTRIDGGLRGFDLTAEANRLTFRLS